MSKSNSSRKHSFWDILGWVAFAYMVCYAILKVVGVIHSLITIDLTIVLSAAYFFGKHARTIEEVSKRVNELSKTVNSLAKTTGRIDTDVTSMKTDMHRLDRNCPLFAYTGTKTKNAF